MIIFAGTAAELGRSRTVSRCDRALGCGARRQRQRQRQRQQQRQRKGRGGKQESAGPPTTRSLSFKTLPASSFLLFLPSRRLSGLHVPCGRAHDCVRRQLARRGRVVGRVVRRARVEVDAPEKGEAAEPVRETLERTDVRGVKVDRRLGRHSVAPHELVLLVQLAGREGAGQTRLRESEREGVLEVGNGLTRRGTDGGRRRRGRALTGFDGSGRRWNGGSKVESWWSWAPPERHLARAGRVATAL